MSELKKKVMWNSLIKLSKDRKISYRGQLVEAIVAAILDKKIPLQHPLPSSRELAKQLGIARNTVIHAYQQLIDEDFLIAKERFGYYVNQAILSGRIANGSLAEREAGHDAPTGLTQKIKFHPSKLRNIGKISDWDKYPYPFLYGQLDTATFPLQGWRDCCRQVLNVTDINNSTPDRLDIDDTLLVEQIKARILSRRGVWASPDQILITMGNAAGIVYFG